MYFIKGSEPEAPKEAPKIGTIKVKLLIAINFINFNLSILENIIADNDGINKVKTNSQNSNRLS